MKKTILKLLFSVVCAGPFILGCQSKPRPQEPPLSLRTARPAEKGNLTEEEAQLRASLVSDVTYQLSVTMDDHSDSFEGKSKAHFNLVKLSDTLNMDFRAGAIIQSFSVNGTETKDYEYKEGRVHLPGKLLQKGANTVDISYTQKYSKDGTGLYRFADPEDHKIYFYTQFETYDANHMFPCFDQPDLKATMKLTVSAPQAWQVISTTRETSAKESGHYKIWNFPETPRLSTYLFSLHAGPYAQWTSTAGNIPLRLFARQSMKKYIQPREWFVPTQQGLKFYGDYFGVPYPFKKYDQIIVPDFNAGAMENVAAVTFTEWVVHRGASTFEQREQLANIILHEMAHMWFGDLVTMRWWSGLWLNESFATYMSDLSSSRATEFKQAWMNFFRDSKARAYIEDQRQTTHPIQGPISDTESALANFDGITYAKGSSVLKQLSYFLGEDKFRQGLQLYFQQNSYKNAEISDFIHALEKSSGRDLSTWSHLWLETAGLDNMHVEYSCQDNKISQFNLILQAPQGQSALRPHKTQVGLYGMENGNLRLQKTFDVDYKTEITPVQAVLGQSCPSMVYPNVNDNDYVKIRLDQNTLKAAKDQLSKIEDPYTRLMFWSNLYEMVRDTDLSPQEYLHIAEQNFPQEKELAIGIEFMRNLPRMIYYLPQGTAEEKAFHTQALQKFENILWQKMQASPAGSDWQKTAFDSYVRLAQTPEAMDRLAGLLSKKQTIKGLTIDQDRRWSMVVLLYSVNDPRADDFLKIERKKDKSERAIQSSLSAIASQPLLDVKQHWLDRISNSPDMTLARTRSVLGNFLPSYQANLRADLSERFYHDLPTLAKTRDSEFLNVYTWSLIPTTCEQQSSNNLDQFIRRESSDLPPLIIKTLKSNWEEDSRCVKIRAKASASR